MNERIQVHHNYISAVSSLEHKKDLINRLKRSVIDDLTAYDDIRLFPELYDTSTIIERITGEADLIERQLR